MTTHAEDLAAIRQLAEEWHAGWQASDVEALLALYAEDPVLMPENQPAVIGSDAIWSLYHSVFDECTVKGSGEIIEIEIAGNWDFFWLNYTISASPKSGGELIEDEGKSIFIVKRGVDGSWKIARLIANSDRPQPTA
jgi:uncharacterized protein (TIGR02246 family)